MLEQIKNFFENVYISNQIEISDFISAIAIILTLITIIITIVTNRKNSKSQQQQIEKQREQIERQEKQFNLQLEEERKKHIENMKFNNEINRTTLLPFLRLIPEESSFDDSKEYYYFKLKIKNVGNGTAVNITMDYLKDDTSLVIAKGCGYKIIQSDANTILLQPNESYETGVSLIRTDKIDENQEHFKIKFKMLFNDMLGREYEQDIQFLFSKPFGNEIRITNEYCPICKKDII